MNLNKKVLIWHTFDLLERQGGPSTYLFHLKSYFENNHIQIDFLGNHIDFTSTSNKKASLVERKTFGKKITSIIIPFFIRNAVRINQNLIEHLKKNAILDTRITKSINIHNYDIIHFHSSQELFQCINLLKKYKGKVVLTTHTPMAPHLELIAGITPRFMALKSTVKALESIDIEAYKRADILLFPCEEAREPYFNSWPIFESLIKGKNIKYLPTGVPLPKFFKEKDEIRKEYNIPQDAIVLSYIGRHNYVKGYQLLKEFGKKALKKYPNLFFLIAGKEEPLVGLKHAHWIEAGWTQDPFSYINASDMLILPNLQTYFDLILPEALSLSKPIMLSNTGGNKYFKKFNQNGFFFLDKTMPNEMLNLFGKIYSQREQLKKKGEANYEVYEKHFTIKEFAVGYHKIYNTM